MTNLDHLDDDQLKEMQEAGRTKLHSLDKRFAIAAVAGSFLVVLQLVQVTHPLPVYYEEALALSAFIIPICVFYITSVELDLHETNSPIRRLVDWSGKIGSSAFLYVLYDVISEMSGLSGRIFAITAGFGVLTISGFGLYGRISYELAMRKRRQAKQPPQGL